LFPVLKRNIVLKVIIQITQLINYFILNVRHFVSSKIRKMFVN
jgi:hypothetical protein